MIREMFIKAAEHQSLSLYVQLISQIRIDCGLSILRFSYNDLMMMKNKVQTGTKGGAVRLKSGLTYKTYHVQYSELTNSLFFCENTKNIDNARQIDCSFNIDNITEISFNFSMLFPEIPYDFEVLLKLGKIASEVGYDMWYSYD